ncbi:glycosyltransferase, partial [Candidatus Pelagibacter sp.]|nr:glycosyltransferase [Candidatus Pelagibacter sp.]
MDKKKNLLSIIVPTYKGEATIVKLVKDLFNVFEEYKIEVIIINDCSPDNTHELCKKLIEEFPKNITYIRLSKNFGEHNAVMAGLRNCDGEHAIIMDDDYQNLPSEALKLTEYTLKNDFDVVFTKYAIKEDSFARNIMSKVANLSAESLINKPKNIYLSSFKIIKRNLINEIIKYTGPYPYIDGLILSKTHNIGSCEVLHAARKNGKSSYNLLKLGKHFSNLIINFSTKPIHFFSVIGLIILTVSIIFLIITIVEKIINPNIPQGYSTLMTLIIFFSGV